MSDHRITDGVIWITGGSSGIGKAVSEKLAEQGYKVAITARRDDSFEAIKSQYPSHVHIFPGDVTDAEKMQTIVDTIESQIGPIGCAVLNAGVYKPDHVEDFTAQNLEKHFAVNMIGIAKCVEPLLKVMLPRNTGQIVMMGSVSGYRGLPKALSYGATKAAVNNFAQSLAVECHHTNLKIQVINPGFVKTPLTDENDFDMPMIIPVEKAADQIVKGMHSNAFEITTPPLFAFILKLIGLLPQKLYIKLAAKLKEQEMKA